MASSARVLTAADLGSGETSELFHGRDHDVGVSFFLNHTPPGRGPAPHRHPYPEVFVLRGGEATFEVDGERLTAGAGHVIVVPAGAVHGFTNTGDEPLDLVSIHPVATMETEWM